MALWASETAGGGTGGGPISSADITDASASGRSVLTGTPAQGRAALGAGTSSFSGAYNDLSGKPALGTAASADASAFATAAQGVKADAAQPKIGTPAGFSSRALTAADDGSTQVCATAQVATVNTGIGASGFNSCLFDGPVSFSGTATINDNRAPGAAYASCTLYRTDTDTYRAVGVKA